MLDNNYYVYMVLRKEDSKTLGADVAPAGSPVYVGISGAECRFHNLKRGRLTFEGCQIHKLAEGLTKDEAIATEIELIARYGRLDLGTGMLTNMTDGGEGLSGIVHTAETRAKMSAAKKGRTYSPETRAKMSAARMGKSRSPETRAKIAASNARKLWCVATPDGRIMFVKNMAKFSRDHGLNHRTMSKVAQGTRKQHKGYRCWKEED